jgi:toxin ParE1/3/4
MAKAILAERARRDLIEIRKHTVKRWGKEQARKYIEQIYRYADELANRRLPGKSREDVAPNLKSYHVGRHVIFYVESKEGIEIARVLHDSMDFVRHFP